MRSRRFLFLPLVAGLLAFAAATASAHTDVSAAGPSVARCGSLWPIRTLSDRNRSRVNLNAQNTSIPALASRSAPAKSPSTRSAFERQAYTVAAQIVRFRADSAGLHLLLFKDTAYVLATLPSAGCLPKYARARSVMLATRKWFNNNCGTPTSSWQPLGAVVRATGVGFWGSRTAGAASNGAEFAPLYGINPIVGCGAKG